MKRKHRKKRAAARNVRRQAQKLARAHTRDLGTTEPEDRRPVEQSVRLLAEYLPTEGTTIHWEAIDVPGFFALIGALSRSDQERTAQHLMGFYYWLCVQQLASVENVAEILDELVDLFPESGSLSMLHRFSMIGLAGGIEAVLGTRLFTADPAALN